MTKTIEIEVGDLYANLHEQYSSRIEDYDGQIRVEVEDFLHELNQQVERQMEQQQEAIESTEREEE